MSVDDVVIYTSCVGYGVWKSFLESYFFQKEFFGELIVFQHLNMDFKIFLTIIFKQVD